MRNNLARIACAALLIAALVGCSDEAAQPEPSGPIAFEDVTEQAGIAFRHFNAVRGSVLPEDMGSGAAWGDANGDGWEDLYLVNYGAPLLASDAELEKSMGNRLYLNQKDGTFKDHTVEAGLERKARTPEPCSLTWTTMATKTWWSPDCPAAPCIATTVGSLSISLKTRALAPSRAWPWDRPSETTTTTATWTCMCPAM